MSKAGGLGRPSPDSEGTVSQAISYLAKEESADPPTSSTKTLEDPDSTPGKEGTAPDIKGTPSAPKSHAISSDVPSLLEMPAPAVIPPPPL